MSREVIGAGFDEALDKRIDGHDPTKLLRDACRLDENDSKPPGNFSPTGFDDLIKAATRVNGHRHSEDSNDNSGHSR